MSLTVVSYLRLSELYIFACEYLKQSNKKCIIILLVLGIVTASRHTTLGKVLPIQYRRLY